MLWGPSGALSLRFLCSRTTSTLRQGSRAAFHTNLLAIFQTKPRTAISLHRSPYLRRTVALPFSPGPNPPSSSAWPCLHLRNLARSANRTEPRPVSCQRRIGRPGLSPLCHTRHVPRKTLLLLALCWFACGSDPATSSKTDARTDGHCDEETPCAAPERPFCDIRGEFPASEGIPNTCIPDPASAECVESEDCLDPERAHCSSAGQCVICLNFSHCNAVNPVCSLSEQKCIGCRQGDEGNSICNAIDPLQPFCGAEGSCVECLESSQCQVITSPICSESGVCRGCSSDSECGPQSCNLASGACE